MQVRFSVTQSDSPDCRIAPNHHQARRSHQSGTNWHQTPPHEQRPADRAGTRRVPPPPAARGSSSIASPHSPPVHSTARHGQISEEQQKKKRVPRRPCALVLSRTNADDGQLSSALPRPPSPLRVLLGSGTAGGHAVREPVAGLRDERARRRRTPILGARCADPETGCAPTESRGWAGSIRPSSNSDAAGPRF